jgi:hypothetical protein
LKNLKARAERVRREVELIAKAHADIGAGLGISDDELEALLDELDGESMRDDEGVPPGLVRALDGSLEDLRHDPTEEVYGFLARMEAKPQNHLKAKRGAVHGSACFRPSAVESSD